MECPPDSDLAQASRSRRVLMLMVLSKPWARVSPQCLCSACSAPEVRQVQSGFPTQVVCSVAWRGSNNRHAQPWDQGADFLRQQVEHLRTRPPFDPHLLQQVWHFWTKPSSALHKN